ncbi:hypothetical protein DXG01_001269, partial [Tephrocybe rancida]
MGKGGSNGVVMAVLGLTWWGSSLEEIGRKAKDTGSWAGAVCDFKCTLQALAVQSFTEREGQEETETEETEERPPA